MLPCTIYNFCIQFNGGFKNAAFDEDLSLRMFKKFSKKKGDMHREIAPLFSVANSKQEFRHYSLPRVA
jgi:hypothetical protein